MAAIPPKSLQVALDWLAQGGRLIVRTSLRVTIIDQKALNKFKAAGLELLREEGDGYRLRMGKGSVYLFPGQLETTPR
jgi:hypothetical protein